MLNLIVIYTKNIESALSFYQSLGLLFIKEKYNKGVEHYACEMSDVVFEIYPENEKYKVDSSTKLGFKVQSKKDLLDKFNSLDIGYSESENSVIAKDFDGRMVFIQYVKE